MLRFFQPPRVVCSSKDACYLCDFFITTGTKFHSPKCHGRLYPGWRLPALSAQDETLRRFNDRLEQEVCNSVKNLLKTQKKLSLPDPRESTILTIRQSVSTLAPPSDNMDAARDDSTLTSGKASSEHSKPSTIALSNSCLQVAADGLEHPVTCHDGSTARQITVLETTHDQSQGLLPSGNEGHTPKKQDPKRSNPMTVCVARDNVSCMRFGPIRLHVEYSASHDGGTGDVRKDLTFDAEWITDVKDQLTNDHSESTLIDVGRSTYTASLPLDKLNRLDINHKGKVLRIRLHP
ncbi:heterokaryon incompatibility [Fusarium flagelliforme]|uniref:Heterokaryon incompatibility n=1 Tax=Fusarium flagelliforme TaxID=2675880 RepID=A0A395M555_9HYPO|nr:heterokaryon incompatibility [Fusarium flagelliforme]